MIGTISLQVLQAISFGDLNDPASRVSQEQAHPRAYAMLGELKVVPRLKYLARLRNPRDGGGYEADIKLGSASTYYVFVGSSSLDLQYHDMPFLSLIGTSAPAAESQTQSGEDA